MLHKHVNIADSLLKRLCKIVYENHIGTHGQKQLVQLARTWNNDEGFPISQKRFKLQTTCDSQQKNEGEINQEGDRNLRGGFDTYSLFHTNNLQQYCRRKWSLLPMAVATTIFFTLHQDAKDYWIPGILFFQQILIVWVYRVYISFLGGLISLCCFLAQNLTNFNPPSKKKIKC